MVSLLYFYIDSPRDLSAGINSFTGNVELADLQLPSDNPTGGIDFVAVTGLNNPR